MNDSKTDSEKAIPEKGAAAVGMEGFEEADFEQKVILIWENYRQAIIAVIGVIILSVLIYQTMLYLAERGELAVQAAYQEADDDEALIEFAREHPRHTLAGMAYLQLANTKYGDEDYAQAFEFYDYAITHLENKVIQGRARLGMAMSHLMMGNGDEGAEALRKIASDPLLLDTFRAEAAYNLAVIFWEKNDFISLERELRRIESFKKAGLWISRSTVMRNSIPELRDLAEGVDK